MRSGLLALYSIFETKSRSRLFRSTTGVLYVQTIPILETHSSSVCCMFYVTVIYIDILSPLRIEPVPILTALNPERDMRRKPDLSASP